MINFGTNRLIRLLRLVNSEEDFIKEAVRFWRWYMTPEIRHYTREHLRRFYNEHRTNRPITGKA